jgi:hypothetical protein
MKQVIIGYGEIGKAVNAVVGNSHIVDTLIGTLSKIPKDIDIMHVCIPYSDKFVQIVLDYILEFSPSNIIIYSTVPIGTTKQIPRAVHSPVEGVHPELEMSIRFMGRWVGYNDEDLKIFYKKYFTSIGLKVRLIPNSDFTEALKLLSTTEYGVNLVFADYKAKLAKSIKMDYKYTQQWNEEYNRLYQNLGMGKKYQKYVLTDPGGKIGGHCVVPNAKLLKNIRKHPMLDSIIKMEIK